MAEWTVIVKNNSGTAQWIADFGILLSNGSQVNLTDVAAYDEIGGSKDLKTKVAAGDLTINDGTSDLSAADGLNFITLENLEDLYENYWNKSELASGGGIIHWDNLTNVPEFGAPTWLDPVLVRAIDVTTPAPTAGASENDFYVDTSDDVVYQYISSTWTASLTASESDRVINLADTEESIYMLSGGIWTDLGAPSISDAVLVNDDGDGKQAQYIYNSSDSWVKLADIDFSVDLSDLESDVAFLSGAIDANASDITTLQSDDAFLSGAIDTNASDITTLQADDAFLSGAIDTNTADISYLSGAISDVTLDDAYDDGGSGLGRTIYVDSGSVQLSAGSSGYSPLEITPTSTMPTSGLADGQLTMNGGILYTYDATRGKWLSVQRQFIAFGREAASRDQYIKYYGGGAASNLSGLRLARNATIVSLAGQLDSSDTCTFNIRRNDVVTNLTSLTISAALGNQLTNINTDLSQGDFLQCYLDTSGSVVQTPMLIIELAWRP